MDIGKWDVNVQVGMLPQEVATEMSALTDSLVGAKYEPIAYLGSQVVNGTNYAVLAKQTLFTTDKSENVVILIFNKKPNEKNATLVNIERVVSGGVGFGGVKLDVTTDLTDEQEDIFEDAFVGYVGSNPVPYAFLGTQATKGIDYIYAAVLYDLGPRSSDDAVIVVVNPMTKKVSIVDLLKDKYESTLGYAFNW